MRLFKYLVFFLLIAQPVFAQSTNWLASYQVSNGVNQPVSTTTPLPVGVYGGSSATSGYCLTSNGPGSVATFQVCGGGGGGGAITIGTTIITGGTNSYIVYNNNGVVDNESLTSIGTSAGTLPVANGGTGASSQTTNGIAYYNGTAIATGTSLVYNSGNVGINAPGASYTLQIGGTNTSQGQLYVTGTANGVAAITLVPSVVSSGTSSQYLIDAYEPPISPSGASLASLYGMSLVPYLTASSTPVTNVFGVYSRLDASSSYTGTITNGYAFAATSPSLGTSTPITSYAEYYGGAITNGNGLATGTVNNYGVLINPSTAASAGGTINNYAAYFNMPAGGSSSGTTSNYGLKIIGNGGTASGGTVNNYAIYSSSTANSYFAGNVGIGTTPPLSKLDVSGSVAIGTSYAGVTAAPTNGAIIQGNVGIGTTSPNVPLEIAAAGGSGIRISRVGNPSTYISLSSPGGANTAATIGVNGVNVADFDLNGGIAIGTSYANNGANPPSNGLLVQGNVGIGTTPPLSKLDVSGSVAIGTSYAGVTAAPTNGAIIQGNVGIGTASPITNSILSLSGHLGFYQAAAPVVSSCGSGTAVAGSTDSKGQVTGIVTATACTITFGTTMPTAPACVFSDSAGTAVGISSISTAAVTTTMTSLTGSLYYICY